ncbi:DNA translocase FtsK [Cytobacillus dafuensis]|uniref:DNA translocase FtsK n=1 Tax=Cytobacillus dafuensis TaxID=1742359 RepID=A0A5B8Z9K7_CYTDA|nr:DNA translocase FtsK [Cytobacillus dafuensis]QED48973.1 DNA translocase FtsK [Cytobacillus dafuensis]
MSWIKKLFQMFRDDEDQNEFNEENMIHNHQDYESETYSQKGISKDVNAKVVYQYPKGQFRFPLIPDDNQEQKIKGERNRNIEREKVSFSPKTKEEKPKRNPEHQYAATTKNKNEKEVSKRKRPFRPTEIPSPIYGYNRPKTEITNRQVKTEPIEYELTDSVYDDMKEKLEPKEVLRSITEELIDPSSYENTNKIEALADQLLENQQEEPIFSASVMETQESTSEESPNSIDHYQVIEEKEDLETRSSVFEINNEEKVSENSKIIVDQESNIEQNVSRIPSEESKLEEKISSPTRKHIPFNVLMLKNDKQKLTEKTETIPSPAIENNYLHDEETKSDTISVEKTFMDEEISYYEFPYKSLLSPPVYQEKSSDWLIEQEELLNSTLINFNVRAKVVNVTQGPSVTRFEVQPEPGVKVNKITNLTDDIKLSLAARDIRIEAPIPGKHTIGIEVPNKASRPVFISEIINSPVFNNHASPLTAVLGLDIGGNPIVTDLRKMPHGLIAGATGSGKSVCINSILVSLLYKATPDELKLILIDPKMVELAPYNQIPHLVSPVITDVKAATAALKWAVDEMERRYELFAHAGVRDINRFNEVAEEHKRYSDKLPYMVIIIDELADLMMMSPADVEEAICRIAQKARACGIHLIIATQRPSVDVITGLIKANVPTRIAFSVSSQIDSRTIIDISGAEKLLGRGDMLFLENGSSKPVRLQGTYVSDQEIDAVVAHVRKERAPEYLFEQEELLKKTQVMEDEDELFYEACEFVIDQGAASTSSLQRRFKIGYNRAARLIDMMEKQGFISETRGSKPREVLITDEELESILDTSTIN